MPSRRQPWGRLQRMWRALASEAPLVRPPLSQPCPQSPASAVFVCPPGSMQPVPAVHVVQSKVMCRGGCPTSGVCQLHQQMAGQCHPLGRTCHRPRQPNAEPHCLLHLGSFCEIPHPLSKHYATVPLNSPSNPTFSTPLPSLLSTSHLLVILNLQKKHGSCNLGSEIQILKFKFEFKLVSDLLPCVQELVWQSSMNVEAMQQNPAGDLDKSLSFGSQLRVSDWKIERSQIKYCLTPEG